MQFKSLIPVIASVFATLAAAQDAGSVQVNFYFDEGCQNFAGSEFIDFNGAGEYSSGGPAGSQGGLYVNGDGIAFRGFSNSLFGAPFTGNLVDGECIGTLGGIFAVFDI